MRFICEYCGKEYEKEYSNQKYCSPMCSVYGRAKKRRKRVILPTLEDVLDGNVNTSLINYIDWLDFPTETRRQEPPQYIDYLETRVLFNDFNVPHIEIKKFKHLYELLIWRDKIIEKVLSR